MDWPKSISSPVLDSVRYAVESSRDVRTNYVPQIDARFRTHFHATTWPHHLTQTIMY